jgi:hypothetical protein
MKPGPLYKKEESRAHKAKGHPPLVKKEDREKGVTCEWLPFGQKRSCSKCGKVMKSKSNFGGLWVLLDAGKVSHYYGQCNF